MLKRKFLKSSTFYNSVNINQYTDKDVSNERVSTWMFLHVLCSEFLSFLHKGSLLVLAQHPPEVTQHFTQLTMMGVVGLGSC